MTETTETAQAIIWDPETIVRELNRVQERLPEEAMRAAQQQRDRVVPALVKLVADAASEGLAGREPVGRGHDFALILLAEFRAKEVLPAFLRTLRLPDDGAFELYGDVIHEAAPRILACLMDDQPFAIDDLIADRECSRYARWDAVRTYLYFVRDGIVTREQALEHLGQHLRQTISDNDDEMATYIVNELLDYGPSEIYPIIDEADEQFDLFDLYLFAERDLQSSLEEGPSRLIGKLKELQPTGIKDAVEYLRAWYEEDGVNAVDPILSRPRPFVDRARERERERDELPLYSPPIETIRNTTRKVGRNEPCPCGSGKKHKKCCGAS